MRNFKLEVAKEYEIIKSIFYSEQYTVIYIYFSLLLYNSDENILIKKESLRLYSYMRREMCAKMV